MSDRVLVTGATGFIGYHLVAALLDKGDHVSCLVRPTSDTSNLPVSELELRTGDIRDPESLFSAVKGVDTVYHLAGTLAGHDLAELKAVNELGPTNVARACAALEAPPTLILVSSIEAAGPDPSAQPRTEEDRATPVSNYGRSKLAGEYSVSEFADAVPISIVRASGVFGEGDRETFAIAKALEIPGFNAYAIPRAHTVKVSVIHARDLADLLLLAAKRGERIGSKGPLDQPDGRGLYYAADEDVLTMGELFGMVAEARTGDQIPIFSVPMVFAWITAGVMEGWARIRGRSPGVITLDKIRSFSSGSFTCSPAKAKQQLGFSPARSLRERIGETVLWYQAEGLL